jgi:dTDP-D-glucose 4,6-dehydratase
MHSVLITGGAGFIGQNLVHAWRAARPADWLVVVGAMTYAANVESGLRQTVRWYIGQQNWWRDMTSGVYKAWIDKNYGFRIAV